MCTVITLIRPGQDWPVILAANRDERLDRDWDLPAEHWSDHPGVIGGRDRSAGGTWMAMNRYGVVAAVLNRPGTLGPAVGKRSRGELPLIAAMQDTAASAVTAITAANASEWRGFNLVLADASGAFFVRGVGHGAPQASALPDGLSMVTAHDPNDPDSPRVARHLPRFAAAPAPRPGDWRATATSEKLAIRKMLAMIAIRFLIMMFFLLRFHCPKERASFGRLFCPFGYIGDAKGSHA